jgi:hypothetical protein
MAPICVQYTSMSDLVQCTYFYSVDHQFTPDLYILYIVLHMINYHDHTLYGTPTYTCF